MRIFKRIENSLFNYLDKEIDKAQIKAICKDDLNEIAYMKLAINIAASYIASAISTCTFNVYNSDGIVRDINYYKLNIAPNPNETAARLKYQMVKELVTEGSALVVQYKNNLYFAESYGFADDSILGYKFDGVTIQGQSIDKVFNRKTSFYFVLDDERAKELLNSIDDKYKTLISRAIKKYKNSINNKWRMKIDAMKQNDPGFEKEYEEFVTAQVRDFITSDEAVYPEMNGYQLEHIDTGKNDIDSSDIRNIRKDIFDMVSQTFKIPVSMMYGNVTNLKEVVNQFITFSVIPYTKTIAQEMTRVFFSEADILNGYRIEIDTSSINYRDIFDIADGIDKLISDGVACIDEVRKLINLPVLNTDFSKKHWMTKNYSKIENRMNEIEENAKKNTSDNISDNNSDNKLKGGDVDEEQ